MDWISPYQVVLFDFDGLLVDTEPLHYAAYMQMAHERGVPLDWDFTRFCKEAHGRENGFFYALQKEYPHVFEQGLSREILYADKTHYYIERLKTVPLSLMEGAASVLLALQEKSVKRAVVTNSPRAQIELIQSKLPLLKTIPLWITREDYTHAKPSAEGYLKALERLDAKGERAIGFEDTLKGIKALIAADVNAVFVCPSSCGPIKECQQLGAKHIETLLESWQFIMPS